MPEHCAGCRCAEIEADKKYEQERVATAAKMKAGEAFAEDELIYAAGSRCEACGAGMAYPKGIGISGSWYCSAVLKRTDKPEDFGLHTALPFAFYEVKSENQPSAHGATTRPTAAA